MYNRQHLTNDEITTLWIFTNKLEILHHSVKFSNRLMEYIIYKELHQIIYKKYSHFLDDLKEKYEGNTL